ncbi:MAG TPA: PDZ domain-containing protein [Terriglobales bacterium]|jgi:serine protease Do|nr:PDZ domain-containing protein [Terriglobales bacterium]
MKRFIDFLILLVVLGTVAAAQAPAPAAPAKPAAPAAPAVPAKPAAPAVPATPAKRYSYLGVTVHDVTPEKAASLKLKEARGAEVVLVDSDSPAGKAGLKVHDVVLSFNGRNVKTPEELRRLIRDTPPEQTVELGISRDGQPLTIKAQLADRHRITIVEPRVKNRIVRIPRMEIPIITTFARRDGVVVENLTPQLGEVFGIKDGQGVLVRSVENGSAGETAGLHAGDVIVRIGNQRISGTSDWNRALREQKPGPVQLGIMRDKRQQTLSLNLPESSGEQTIIIPGDAFAKGMEHFADGMKDFHGQMFDFEGLQPEIERSMREAQEKIQRELERSQREIERAQRQAQRAQEQAQRAQERAERERERAQEQAERAQEQAQEQAEHERERAQEQAERERERAQEQAERERSLQQQQPPDTAQPQPPQPPKPPLSEK